MVLYMIGLGLGDADDITVKGLKLVQGSDLVFLEAYTSILGPIGSSGDGGSNDNDNDGDGDCDGKDGDDGEDKGGVVLDVMGCNKSRLEESYGKSIIVADRDMVETQAEERILEPARTGKVAFLVVGDPVCATTHTDLMIRAGQMNIDVEVVHNASIMGAAGTCGLQLYNFGHTVSIPFFDGSWRPTSFYPKIRYNRLGGMHTLCLLDIKVKEPDYDAMIRGRGKVSYLPPRFMTVGTAAQQLVEAENKHGMQSYDPSKTLCVGLARMGQPTQCILAGTLQELIEHSPKLGGPLHSLIICGHLHELELEVIKQYLVEGSSYQLDCDVEEAEGDQTDKKEQP